MIARPKKSLPNCVHCLSYTGGKPPRAAVRSIVRALGIVSHPFPGFFGLSAAPISRSDCRHWTKSAEVAFIRASVRGQHPSFRHKIGSSAGKLSQP